MKPAKIKLILNPLYGHDFNFIVFIFPLFLTFLFNNNYIFYFITFTNSILIAEVIFNF